MRILRALALSFFICGFSLPAHAVPVKSHNYTHIDERLFKEDFATWEKFQQTVGDHLVAYNNNREKNPLGNQIAVLILDSLDGNVLEDYSLSFLREKGIGQQKYNNGILITLVISDRKSRIEVGYGLEWHVTDAESKQILVSMREQLRDSEYALATIMGINMLKEKMPTKEEQMSRAYQIKKDHGGFIILLISLFGGGIVLTLGLWLRRIYTFSQEKFHIGRMVSQVEAIHDEMLQSLESPKKGRKEKFSTWIHAEVDRRRRLFLGDVQSFLDSARNSQLEHRNKTVDQKISVTGVTASRDLALQTKEGFLGATLKSVFDEASQKVTQLLDEVDDSIGRFNGEYGVVSQLVPSVVEPQEGKEELVAAKEKFEGSAWRNRLCTDQNVLREAQDLKKMSDNLTSSTTEKMQSVYRVHQDMQSIGGRIAFNRSNLSRLTQEGLGKLYQADEKIISLREGVDGVQGVLAEVDINKFCAAFYGLCGVNWSSLVAFCEGRYLDVSTACDQAKDLGQSLVARKEEIDGLKKSAPVDVANLKEAAGSLQEEYTHACFSIEGKYPDFQNLFRLIEHCGEESRGQSPDWHLVEKSLEDARRRLSALQEHYDAAVSDHRRAQRAREAAVVAAAAEASRRADDDYSSSSSDSTSYGGGSGGGAGANDSW